MQQEQWEQKEDPATLFPHVLSTESRTVRKLIQFTFSLFKSYLYLWKLSNFDFISSSSIVVFTALLEVYLTLSNVFFQYISTACPTSCLMSILLLLLCPLINLSSVLLMCYYFHSFQSPQISVSCLKAPAEQRAVDVSAHFHRLCLSFLSLLISDLPRLLIVIFIIVIRSVFFLLKISSKLLFVFFVLILIPFYVPSISSAGSPFSSSLSQTHSWSNPYFPYFVSSSLFWTSTEAAANVKILSNTWTVKAKGEWEPKVFCW